MILKCKVSSIDSSGTRVILLDRGNAVTPPIQTAAHVGVLEVGDIVAVVFFNNFSDGLIIAKIT
jgi:hypothetical protein